MTYHVQFPGLGLALTVNRVALSIGGFNIYWYGVIIAAGMMLALLYAFRNAVDFGIDSDRLVDVIAIGTVMAIVCARIYYVAMAPFKYNSIWEMIDIRLGGIAIYGAVIGAFVFGGLAAKWRKIPLLPLFDLVSLGFLIGQGIGRWGNFVNQEAFGTNTTLPWGMYSEGTEAYLKSVQVTLPAGTAHFLEHKMCETPKGDSFTFYAKTGASANAFTSYDRTCYLFSATQKIDENLDILLGMVGKPWFTKATIAKEQGIIGQEIKMYDDSPDWRLLTALFRCLYKSHPIRDDIAGTTQSIAELTPELLYACTDAFYRPGNMVLSVAGNITLDQAVEACRRNGVYDAVDPPQVETIFPQEADTVQHKETTFTMPVNKPCFALGYKEAAINRGDTRMEVIADLLPDLICGGLTNLYRKLYDESLVNPEFSGDYLSTEGACIIAFTGESETPREVAQMVRDEIARLRQNGVDPELFTLVKNQMYGEMLADVENVDDAAEEMGMAFLKGRTLADEIEALATLTVDDVNKALQTMLLEENSAYIQIDPKE